MNKQKIENLITLLNDGKWHSAQELTERVSSHFVAQIYQARKEGYCIETRKVNNNKYEYRIAKEKTSIENLRQLVQNNLQEIPHLKLLNLGEAKLEGQASGELQRQAVHTIKATLSPILSNEEMKSVLSEEQIDEIRAKSIPKIFRGEKEDKKPSLSEEKPKKRFRG